MRRSASALSLVASALALQGCAIVGSGDGKGGGEGVGYMLPKAWLPVELVDRGVALELQIKEPVVMGDPKHTYVLRRSGNVFTSDRTTIEAEDHRGLLKSINVSSEDQSLGTAIKLVSGLRAEAADQATATLIHRGLFDPGWGERDVGAFNTKIREAATRHLTRRLDTAGCAKNGKDAKEVVETCKPIRNMKELVERSPGFEVKVSGGPDEQTTPADCSAGFCYRLNLPHVVEVSGGGISNSAIFSLPNRSPTFVMPLERWAFVKTTHDVQLTGGVFKSITTDRPSSAYTLASAPLDLAKGAISAVSELVKLKIDLSGDEKSLAEAETKELEAKDALLKALLSTEKGKAKAEAAFFGAPRSSGALLSVRIGEASRTDAVDGLKTSESRDKVEEQTNPTKEESGAEKKCGGKKAAGSSGSLGDCDQPSGGGNGDANGKKKVGNGGSLGDATPKK